MMIRPTASSENFGRGNKAYGKSSSYYNPNNESGGKYDLRGDVARIILYQYVRWNCTNTGSKYNPNGIYGTNGVIESRAVLLEWMEADPVDTWELGRNDSVESITGTRNVFVDYPELDLSYLVSRYQVITPPLQVKLKKSQQLHQYRIIVLTYKQVITVALATTIIAHKTPQQANLPIILPPASQQSRHPQTQLVSI